MYQKYWKTILTLENRTLENIETIIAPTVEFLNITSFKMQGRQSSRSAILEVLLLILDSHPQKVLFQAV